MLNLIVSLFIRKNIKRRVKTFEGKGITKFTDKEIPKEDTHYSCFASICIYSLIKLAKENILKSILNSVNLD